MYLLIKVVIGSPGSKIVGIPVNVIVGLLATVVLSVRQDHVPMATYLILYLFPSAFIHKVELRN